MAEEQKPEIPKRPSRTTRRRAADADPGALLEVFRAAVVKGNKVQICLRYAVAHRNGASFAKQDIADHQEAWNGLSAVGKEKVRTKLAEYEQTGMSLRDSTTGPLKKRGKDSTSTKRAGAHLSRLTESGGAPVRVDTHGDDLKLLDSLVANGYAASRAEAYRKSMREAHARLRKMIRKVAK